MEPAANLLTIGRADVAIVISRTYEQPGLLSKSREILVHHNNLHFKIKRRAKIKQITANDYCVESGRIGGQPVELLKRIMNVCDEENLHLIRY